MSVATNTEELPQGVQGLGFRDFHARLRCAPSRHKMAAAKSRGVALTAPNHLDFGVQGAGLRLAPQTYTCA